MKYSKTELLGEKEERMKKGDDHMEKLSERIHDRKTGELLDEVRREQLKNQTKQIEEREKRQIKERKFFDDNFVGIVLFLAVILFLFLSRNY